MASLLDDAIKRAIDHPIVSSAAARLHLVWGEAKFLVQRQIQPDVVYLDPMFPAKSKDALVKGKMQILQKFIGPGHDCAELLNVALTSGVKRTILKRPPKDVQWQSPRRPDNVFSSRSTKYEVYLQ